MSLFRLPSALALSLFAACGGATAPPPPPGGGPAPSASSTPDCAESDCGPRLGMPNGVCEDGSASGPTGRCLRQADGACGWEVRSCPPAAERVCGGIAPSANACREGEFCDFPREATCGAADQTGVCRARPEMCTEEYSPVCGCDDKTYPSACAAARAGVSVSATGECARRTAAEGELCGTRGALPCGDGLFCDFPAQAGCGRSDGPGKCAKTPSACTKELRRVCGCDGTTYANACEANRAGVSVETTAACRPK